MSVCDAVHPVFFASPSVHANAFESRTILKGLDVSKEVLTDFDSHLHVMDKSNPEENGCI